MTERSRDAAKGSAAAKRDETELERADRNLGEILQELRVALPGVQVLFAFLLTVPFSQGFADLEESQRDLYFGILMATAVSTALLIAPSAYHRVLFRQQDKEHLVRVANRLTIAGLLVLAVAIVGAVLLIADLLFKGWEIALYTIAIALIFFMLWVALPLMRRAQVLEEED